MSGTAAAPRVGIVAHGMVPFTTGDAPVESLLLGSARDLFERSPGVGRGDIDAVLVSTNSDSKYLAPILSETAGIRPRIAHSVESLCNSGTNAVVSAYSYVASGLADAVLVSGADLHDGPGRTLEWDVSRGEFGHPVHWASLFARSYKREHGVSGEDLSLVAVKNRRQALKNPHALPGGECTLADVMGSRELTGDLRLLDCSRPCTGSASVVVASEDAARGMTDSPVWITGIGQKTVAAGFAKGYRQGPMESTRLAGRAALGMAGVSPRDVDAAEVHDAFSVFEPLALESLGLADAGGGARAVRDLYETGDRRINPRGGLIGSGHPLGATGIAQAVEITQQLLSEAGPRQVDGAGTGLVHNISAAATSSTVLVLEA